MDIDKIAIIPKISKLQWDMHIYNLNPTELQKKYKHEKIDAKRILNNHHNLQKTIDLFSKVFYNAEFLQRDQINKELLNSFSLVITLGGDNHFQYVSHFIQRTMILGINSDPSQSIGALTSAQARSCDQIKDMLQKNHFRVENWVRLKCILDKTLLEEATCDIYVGSEKRTNMSRYIIEMGNKREEQKSSGVIISSGAGSTSWYNSACRYLYPNGNPLEKDKPMARLIVAEPFRFGNMYYNLLSGEIQGNNSVRIYSISDENIISIDSLKDTSFPRAKRVEISISSNRLKVVKLDIE